MSPVAFLRWVATLSIPAQAAVLFGLAVMLYSLLRIPFVLLRRRSR